MWAIPLVIIVVIALIVVYYINKIVILSNRIDNAWSQIDVQLKKRADLVPNLVETVKGYAKHEKSIMEAVTRARENMLKAGTPKEKIRAGTALSAALRSVFAIAENYPQLKANENFLQLQQELSAIEDKIAYARQYYNDSILSYNTACKTFPGSFFAGIYGKKEKE